MDTGFIVALMDYRVRTSNTNDAPNEHHAASSGHSQPSAESNRLYESALNAEATPQPYYLTKFYLYEEDYLLDRIRYKLAELDRNSATTTNSRGPTATAS